MGKFCVNKTIKGRFIHITTKEFVIHTIQYAIQYIDQS